MCIRDSIAGVRRGVHTIKLRLHTSFNSSTWYLPPGTAQRLREYERTYEGSVLLDFTREYNDEPPPPPAGPPPENHPTVRLVPLHRNYSLDIAELGFVHLSIEDGQVSSHERERYKEPQLNSKQHSARVAATFCLLLTLLNDEVEIVCLSSPCLLYTSPSPRDS